MINMKRPLGKQSGFTLIELMVGLLVLTLMIGAFVGANARAQRTAEEMNERTVALQDANHVIEEMRTNAKNATTCLNGTACTFPSTVTSRYNGTVSGINNLINEAITATYTTVATATVDTHTYVVLKYTVTVTWTSYTGRPFTETVVTYISQR